MMMIQNCSASWHIHIDTVQGKIQIWISDVEKKISYESLEER